MNDLLPLVEPLVPRLRRYARALLRDRAAADDLVQDCLLRVVSGWSRRRQDGDLRAWLFAILHNLALNRIRDEARRGTAVPLDAVDESVFSRPPTQESGLHGADLVRALDSLAPEQRIVLLLVSVEDLSYADVARVLDIPLGTVMSRLSRAREKLARALDPDRPITARPALRRVK